MITVLFNSKEEFDFRMEDNSNKKSHWRILALVCAVTLNFFVYHGAMLAAGALPHYSLALPPDHQIPLIPWTITIYFGCYLFWCVNYIIGIRQEKEEALRFICADALSKLVCGVFFLLLPTTIDRPEITGTDVFSQLMRLLYQLDQPVNLFPSIHCLVSWLCWIGVRKNNHVPRFYQWFSLITAILICISTLTTRQHVLVDVVGGIVLAEFSYYLSGFHRIRSIYARIINFTNKGHLKSTI